MVYPTLQSLAEADISELENYVRSTGFFRAKARDIKATAQILLEKHGGRVPDTMEELLELPGVGRKTANLILAMSMVNRLSYAILTAYALLIFWVSLQQRTLQRLSFN